MPYMSPFNILRELIPDGVIPADKQGITLAKRVVLAEIDLSESKTILLSQGEMTKDDVLRYFDSLNTEDSLEYHFAIFQDKALCDFLEFWKLPQKEFSSNPLYKEPGFRHFITDFFVEALSGVFRDAFHYSDSRLAEKLLKMPKIWDNFGPARFAQQVSHFLDQFDREISILTEEIRGGGYYRFSEIENTLFSPVQIRLLNTLPSEAKFSVDYHVRILIDYSYAFYDVGDNKTASAIIGRLSQTKVPEETQRILRERLNLYKHYVSPLSPKGKKLVENPGKSTESSGLSPWQWVWISIMIINMLRHC